MGYPAKTERNKEIVKKIDKGQSFGEVGKFYNLTKQTVHEIYLREKAKPKKVRQELSTA